jgi:hypothetical protein
MSAIYDSVSDIAFGPVFYTAEGAGEFLTWYTETTTYDDDLRNLTHDQITMLVSEWEAWVQADART